MRDVLKKKRGGGEERARYQPGEAGDARFGRAKGKQGGGFQISLPRKLRVSRVAMKTKASRHNCSRAEGAETLMAEVKNRERWRGNSKKVGVKDSFQNMEAAHTPEREPRGFKHLPK